MISDKIRPHQIEVIDDDLGRSAAGASSAPVLTVQTGSQWAYEITHDGYRFICRRDGDQAARSICLWSRRG
jgi:hypothetical protein